MTKRKVDEAATKAKHNVDQSTTNDTVDQSTQIGISIISNIQPETIQKSLARQAIDDEATIKKSRKLRIITMQQKKKRMWLDKK